MLVTNDADVAARVKFFQYAIGAIPGPLDCYLIMRGIRTLAVRMDRHQENAAKVAAMLSRHERIERVCTPARDPPESQDCRGSDAWIRWMVSVEVAVCARAKAFVEKTKVFTLAESLGGLRASLRYRPDEHVSTSGSLLEIPDNFVRLSVGIEDVDDLLEDLRQALSRATSRTDVRGGPVIRVETPVGVRTCLIDGRSERESASAASPAMPVRFHRVHRERPRTSRTCWRRS